MHNPADVTSVQRKNAEGDKENIPCPKAISDYNMYMGGVDRFHQLMQTYSIGWRSKRWWLKIFYYYIDAAIVNSYIMYKHNLKQTCPKTKPMSHLQFRSLLATELINNYSSRQRPGPSAHGTSVRKQGRADGRVMNIERKMPGKHLPVTSTRRRCAWCSTKRSQKRTSVQCKECKVGLCIDCFVPFHTQMPIICKFIIFHPSLYTIYSSFLVFLYFISAVSFHNHVSGTYMYHCQSGYIPVIGMVIGTYMYHPTT